MTTDGFDIDLCDTTSGPDNVSDCDGGGASFENSDSDILDAA